MRLILIALVVLAAGCATQSPDQTTSTQPPRTLPREHNSTQPSRTLQISFINVLSAISALNASPRSAGEIASSLGRDIREFNSALGSAFLDTLTAELRARGIKYWVVQTSSGNEPTALLLKPRGPVPSTQSLLPVTKAVLHVRPKVIRMNIPGSFAGSFEVTVLDSEIHEPVWTETFDYSVFANGRAHQGVGAKLAVAIVTRLNDLNGLVVAR